MSYVDGFVIPVPKDKKEAYREMAAKAAPVFKEYGRSGSWNAGAMICLRETSMTSEAR